MGKNRRQRKTLKRRRKQRGGASLWATWKNHVTGAFNTLRKRATGSPVAPAVAPPVVAPPVVAPPVVAPQQPTAPATMGGKRRRTRSRKTSGCGTCQLFAGGRKRRSRRTRRRGRRINRRRR